MAANGDKPRSRGSKSVTTQDVIDALDKQPDTLEKRVRLFVAAEYLRSDCADIRSSVLRIMDAIETEMHRVRAQLAN